MNSFVSTVVFKIKADRFREAQDLFGGIARIIPTQPGCIYFQLHIPLDLNALAPGDSVQGSKRSQQQGAVTHAFNTDDVITIYKRDVWEDYDYYDRHSGSDYLTSNLGKIFDLANDLPCFITWERILSEANNGVSFRPAAWNSHRGFSQGREDDSSTKARGRAGDDDVLVVVTHRSCRSNVKPRFQMLLLQLATACRRTGLAETYDVHACLEPLHPNLFMEYSVWNTSESFYMHLEDPYVKELLNELHCLEDEEPKVALYKKFKFDGWC